MTDEKTGWEALKATYKVSEDASDEEVYAAALADKEAGEIERIALAKQVKSLEDKIRLLKSVKTEQKDITQPKVKEDGIPSMESLPPEMASEWIQYMETLKQENIKKDEEIAKIKFDERNKEIDRILDIAVNEGRVHSCMISSYKQIALEMPKQFEQLIAAATPQEALIRSQTASGGMYSGSGSNLDLNKMEICNQTGVSPESVAKELERRRSITRNGGVR